MTYSESFYCHSCGKVHPKADLRLVFNKGRKHKRCVHSLERAAKATMADREAMGKQVTERNREINRQRAQLLNEKSQKI
jgi:hypothetical protein